MLLAAGAAERGGEAVFVILALECSTSTLVKSRTSKFMASEERKSTFKIFF